MGHFLLRRLYKLQEAKNQVYALLTEIMTEEAGYVIYHAIQVSKKESNELKKVIN